MPKFFEKHADKFQIVSESGCYIWTASTKSNGYGEVWHDGRLMRAHRVAFEVANGTIPENIFVCHRCDVPACINPSHLFLGTHTDNMADMARKGRRSRQKGEDNARSKLTKADVLGIRSDTRSHRKIAADFGIHHAQVGRIKARKIWRHIEGGEH